MVFGIKIKQIPCSFILTWKISKQTTLGVLSLTYCCVLFHLNYCSASPEVSWILANCKKTVSYWDYSSSLRLALFVGPAIIRTWRWRQDLTFKWCIWSTQWSILYKCKWTEIWHCKSFSHLCTRKEIRIKRQSTAEHSILHRGKKVEETGLVTQIFGEFKSKISEMQPVCK